MNFSNTITWQTGQGTDVFFLGEGIRRQRDRERERERERG